MKEHRIPKITNLERMKAVRTKGEIKPKTWKNKCNKDWKNRARVSADLTKHISMATAGFYRIKLF